MVLIIETMDKLRKKHTLEYKRVLFKYSFQQRHFFQKTHASSDYINMQCNQLG